MRRSGTGIIRSFQGDPSMVVVGIQRFGQAEPSRLVCNPEVAHRLLKEYGTRKDDFTHMQDIIGLACTWKEHGLCMWEDIQVLPN